MSSKASKLIERETQIGHDTNNPMHQFEVTKIESLDFSLFGIDLSITNAVVAMFSVTFLLIVFLSFLVSALNVLPNRKQALAEILYNFIKNLVTSNINHEKRNKFLPLIFSLFFFIFFANAFGLMPYAFTITSHIAVTASLACIVFFLSIIIGIIKNGPIGFFAALVPSGVPKALAPLMLVIELFTYLARPLTLAIRLAVNMVAGHTMMKVVAGFVTMMGAFGVIPILFNTALTGFEFFVAGLQAYIFSMLSCIYINDALSQH